MRIIFALSAMMAMSGVAQTLAPKEEQPSYKVSFVCIGARSDAYWVGDGPKMKVRAHDPGAAPPKDIFIKTAEDKKASETSGKKDLTSLMLALNVPSARIKLNNNTFDLLARYQSGEAVGFKKYISSQLPLVFGEYTVFLARTPKHKDWSKPQQLVFSDDLSKFPLGAARIVNLSDRPVYVQRGSKVLGLLQPQKKFTIKNVLQLKNAERITLWYDLKGRKIPAFRRALSYAPDQRVNIACSFAPKRAKPILSHLFVTREATQPSSPEKKTNAPINSP